MNILIPLEITAAMVQPGTSIASPDPAMGEVAWAASAAYVVGDERVSALAIYACHREHTGRVKPPEDDAEYWKRKAPSNLFAPFDYYTSTQAKATGSLTLVLRPGFFADVQLYGLVGDSVHIAVHDGPGGPLLKQMQEDLWEQALGLWELLFQPLGKRDKAQLSGIPISPNAQLTVTVTSVPSAPVALGTLNIGEWRRLIGTSKLGGTEYGAEVEPRSYSYIKTYDDGTYEFKRRHSATDVRMSVFLDANQAEFATATLQQVLDLPVAVQACDAPGYGYLNTMGLVTGTVRAEGFGHARANINVKGMI